MKNKFKALLLSVSVLALMVACTPAIKYIGDGMTPTIKNGERYSTDNNAYKSQQPVRGDIIVYHLATENWARVDRVIGVAGDAIDIKNGEVFLNGTKLNEPYTQGTMINSDKQYKVPEGTVFVLNDNRQSGDLDSRGLSFIPLSVVQAKVLR